MIRFALADEGISAMRRSNLGDLAAFIAVADSRSFRAAASRQGLTPSALSHAIRQIEARLGVRLLNRTTRSVALTDAGRRLLERVRPAMEVIDRAIDDIGGERDRPTGRVRLLVTHLAAASVVAPVWGRFLNAFPEVELELWLEDATTDIVERGCDAGVGTRDRIPADMVAVPVLRPMKVAVVAAPAYFARQRPPRTPEDLARHDCIRYRRIVSGQLVDWHFERDGRAVSLPPAGRLTVNDPDVAVRAAVDGLGVAYTIESLAEPFLRSGQLLRVLEDWSPAFQGLYLYHPSRRQVPGALRALIDTLRAAGIGDHAGGAENPFADPRVRSGLPGPDEA
jgi:DNA-binding transcriptional LysR family regulator